MERALTNETALPFSISALSAMPRQTVAAVIPNKNSESTLPRTLDSLRFCDEVVIVDDGSTDRCLEIARTYENVRIFERRSFIYDNFNYGMDQSVSDWIIRLDSDESLSPELQRSIISVLEGPAVHDCYGAFAHLYFFGRRIENGFGKQFRKTLFRRGMARYPCKSEHEDLSYNGTVGELDGHYDHFTNPTISRWMEKVNYYSDKDIERIERPVTTPKRKVIYRTLRNFQRMYLGPGWLVKDGYAGFVVAGIAAFSLFLMHAKEWERATPPDLHE